MKPSVKRILISLLLSFASLNIFAQEKTLAYYNTHESEILPDAQDTFKKGEYERTIELCKWYFIIFGDNKANSLREKSERCDQLSKEMNDLRADGKLQEAKLKASAILSINPNDTRAKAISLIEIPVSPVRDTIAIKPPAEPIDTIISISHEEIITDSVESQKTDPVKEQIEEAPITPVQADHEQQSIIDNQTYPPHTRVVIKAGASILDLKQVSQSIAPGCEIGLYDIGGSPFGGEIGAYLCSGLQESSASLFGVDASLVYRVADKIYPKLGLGFFSCKPSGNNASSTSGMCAGVGVTFLLGGHFCLEIGAKYYPEIRALSSETVTTSQGVSYEFPSVIQITNSGIAPFVSVGWSF